MIIAAATPEPTLPPPIESSNHTPAPPAAKPRSPVMKIDPLDFDPAQFSVAPIQAPPADPASRAGNDAGANPIVEPPAADAPKAPPKPPVQKPTLTVRRGPMPDAAAAPHRLADQLAAPVDSLAVSDMPLARFAQLVTDLTDAPVSLDPMELATAGISPRQLVSADVANTTIEKLLRETFAKHRLELTEQGTTANIALTGRDRRRAVEYDVADLAIGGDASPIARLVAQFVAPETWKEGSGNTITAAGPKLKIDAAQGGRHQVLIFCERLRLARGQSQRSRYPAALLTTESPYAKLAPTLARRTTYTFLPWSRLADVVAHWQQTSKLTILVDWAALADVDLSPSSPVSCSSIDRQWQDVFDESLESLGLGWWAVDGETIQITTFDALNDVRRVEFYVVPENVAKNADSRSDLAKTLEQELNAAENHHPAVIHLDTDSAHLIVLASPAQHRHLSKRLAAPAN
jgi:hypothetical protein